MNPQFPIFIVSKGRAQSRLTVKYLEKINVPYRIVIEDQEYAEYAAVIDKKKIILLDKSYQKTYDAFDKLGLTKSKGSGPARNFVWDLAVKEKSGWHWILDDNMLHFQRLNNNQRIYVGDGTCFRAMEDFVLRYTNIAMAGPNYRGFAPDKAKRSNPYTLNTRIYSCCLIRNDVPFRWRGRYNEDTDLALRMLKAGWCTVLFNAFLQGKALTMTMKGGNTDEIYQRGTAAKSKMLVAMHPDCCTLYYRFKRWHHLVDYSRFQHMKLIKKPDLTLRNEIDNYGMELVTIPR